MTAPATTHLPARVQDWLGPAPRHDPANPAKIDVESVSLWRGDDRILHDVTFKIHAHEITGLVGASGSGAKCLLHCFDRGIDSVPGALQTGLIAIDGEDIRASYLAPAVLRSRVGCLPARVMPSADTVYRTLSTLRSGRRPVPSPIDLCPDVADRLARVQAWDVTRQQLGEPAGNLPAHVRRRVALAALIAAEPDIIIVDEPASRCRTETGDDLADVLSSLRDDFTIVVATDDISLAARMCQRIVVMDAGRIVEKGDAAMLTLEPRHPITKRLIATSAAGSA